VAMVCSKEFVLTCLRNGTSCWGSSPMTWFKFAIASLAFSLAATAAGAFEIVDTNNGFAGPQFQSSDPDSQGFSMPNFNVDDFADAHIYMKADHEKEFDGFSYSGFVFEDQIDQQSISVDHSDALKTQSSDKARDAKN